MHPKLRYLMRRLAGTKRELRRACRHNDWSAAQRAAHQLADVRAEVRETSAEVRVMVRHPEFFPLGG